MSVTNPEERAKRLPPDSRKLYETFRESGMGPGAALAATAGRDGQIPSVDPNEERLEAFQTGGLSEAGAKAAMRGRRLGDSMFVEDAAAPAVKDSGMDKVQREAAKARKKKEAEKKEGEKKTTASESAVAVRREMEVQEFAESLSREELQAVRQSEFYRNRSEELMESGAPGWALEQAEKDTIAKVKELMDNA